VLSFAYCLKEQVLGVGWPVESVKRALEWDAYERLAEEEYGRKGVNRVRYLRDQVMPNDLIWTRDPHGKHFLARVRPPKKRTRALPAWEYLNTSGGVMRIS